MTVSLGPSGIVWLRWAVGANITRDAATRSVEAVSTVARGQRAPLLVDLSGISGLTRDARAIYTRESSVSAVALVGQSPVVRVIANFALGVAKSAVPTRFFSTSEDAVSWLLEQDR